MCNDTVYMPDLSKNSFSVKFAMTKGILRYQRKKIVLKKYSTILKLKECVHHGNDNDYILDARLYTSVNDAVKKDRTE